MLCSFLASLGDDYSPSFILENNHNLTIFCVDFRNMYMMYGEENMGRVVVVYSGGRYDVSERSIHLLFACFFC